ncbi:MAG TPA: hypothetical protein VLX29_11270 [Nitrospirota bacterium]|nr:hypothetical protein [Nitrospirota bacterium]
MVKSNITVKKRYDDVTRAIIIMIHNSSEAGHLITDFDIYTQLSKDQLLTKSSINTEKELESILKKIVKADNELRVLKSKDGSRHYYTIRYMTEAYALILFQKRGNRKQFIAEIVRQNSIAYPRPIPLDMFCVKPFELTNQEVMESLTLMSKDRTYRDIVQTTTSTQRVFLYSSHHLEPEHATMLAEWFDVGRSNNP